MDRKAKRKTGSTSCRSSGGTTLQIKTVADNTPPNALAVPKTVFSCAMTVVCDGQGRPLEDLRQVLVIIRECVSWVCEDALWEHEWVMGPNVLWRRTKFWKD